MTKLYFNILKRISTNVVNTTLATINSVQSGLTKIFAAVNASAIVPWAVEQSTTHVIDEFQELDCENNLISLRSIDLSCHYKASPQFTMDVITSISQPGTVYNISVKDQNTLVNVPVQHSGIVPVTVFLFCPHKSQNLTSYFNGNTQDPTDIIGSFTILPKYTNVKIQFEYKQQIETLNITNNASFEIPVLVIARHPELNPTSDFQSEEFIDDAYENNKILEEQFETVLQQYTKRQKSLQRQINSIEQINLELNRRIDKTSIELMKHQNLIDEGEQAQKDFELLQEIQMRSQERIYAQSQLLHDCINFYDHQKEESDDDQQRLEQKIDEIWNEYFHREAQMNIEKFSFKKRAKTFKDQREGGRVKNQISNEETPDVWRNKPKKFSRHEAKLIARSKKLTLNDRKKVNDQLEQIWLSLDLNQNLLNTVALMTLDDDKQSCVVLEWVMVNKPEHYQEFYQEIQRKFHAWQREAQGLLDNVSQQIANGITNGLSPTLTSLTEKMDELTSRFVTTIGSFIDKAAPTYIEEVMRFLFSFINNLIIMKYTNGKLPKFLCVANILSCIPFRVYKQTPKLMPFLNSAVDFVLKYTRTPNQTVQLGNAVFNSNQETVELDELARSAQGKKEPIKVTESETEHFFLSMVKFVGSFIMPKNDIDLKKENMRVQRILNLSRFVGGCKTISDFFTTLIPKLVNGIEIWIYGEPNLDDLMAKVSEEIPMWIHQNAKYRVSCEGAEIITVQKLFEHYDKKRELVTHYQQGLIFQRKLLTAPKGLVTPQMLSWFHAELRHIEKIMTDAGASFLGVESKHEPFVIYVYGEPGVGKTFLTDYLLKGMYKCLGEDYVPKRDKFSKSQNTDYWEGYANQKVYFIDDFFQSKEDATRHNLIGNFILHVSRAPSPLNMANASAKGQNYFTSDVIYMTAQGNFLDLDNYVVSKDAFQRRLHVKIKVRVKDEYATGKNEFKQQEGEYLFNPHANLYTVIYDQEKSTSVELEFKDMVMLVAKLKREHKNRQIALDKDEMDFGDLKTEFDAKYSDKREAEVGSFMSWVRTKLWEQPDKYEMPPEYLDYSSVALRSGIINIIHTTLLKPELINRQDELQQLRRYIIDASCYPYRIEPDLVEFVETITELHRLERAAIISSQNYEMLFNRRSADFLSISGFLKLTAAAMTLSAFVALIVTHWNSQKVKTVQDKIGEWKSDTFSAVEEISEEIAKAAEFIGSGDNQTARKRQNKQVRKKAHGGDAIVNAQLRNGILLEKNFGNRCEEFFTRIAHEKIHVHQCYNCKQKFIHMHEFEDPDHDHEDEHRCPNPTCSQYIVNNEEYEPLRDHHELDVDKQDIAGVIKKLMAEGSRDVNLMQIMEAHKTSFVRVRVPIDDENVNAMTGLFLKGKILMFPKHIFSGLDIQKAKVIISSRTMSAFSFMMSNVKYHVNMQKDLCFVEVPMDALMPDITKQIIKEDELLSTVQQGYLIKLTQDMTPLFLQVRDITAQEGFSYQVATSAEVIQIVKGYDYVADTQKGDCGALLYASSCQIPRKIMGMHVAGAKQLGSSTSLTYEFVMENLKKFNLSAQVLNLPIDYHSVQHHGILAEQDPIIVLGRAHRKAIPYTPTKTKIQKSVLFDQIVKHTTKPCLLTRTNGVDPCRIAFQKSLSPMSNNFNPYCFEIAYRGAANHILSFKSSYKENPKLWDDKINLNGIDGDDWISPIALDTSAGYPWDLKSARGKRDFVRGELGNFIATHEIQNALNVYERALKTNEFPPFIFQDTLKDERKAIEQVDRGKTRLFSACPFEVTLLVRRYYGQFLAYLMDTHLQNDSAVGLNVHSDEWGILYNRLKAKGDFWVAGDFKSFDGKLPGFFMMAFARMANEFYNDDEENQRVRTNIMFNIINSVHIFQQTFYLTNHGMPSGVPITAVGNSIINSIIMRYIYVDSTLDCRDEIENCEDLAYQYDHYVAGSFYGDDHIMRVSNITPWMNQITIKSYCEDFGMIYTSAMKEEQMEYETKDCDLSFLKRSFREDNGYLFAPLPIENLLERINWIRKGQDPVMLTQLNVESALLDLVHHGEQTWNYWYRKINDVCRRFGRIKLPSWNFVHAKKILMTTDMNFVQENIILPIKKSEYMPLIREAQGDTVGVTDTSKVDEIPVDDDSFQVSITTFNDQSEADTFTLQLCNEKPNEDQIYRLPTIDEWVTRMYPILNFRWSSENANIIQFLEFPHHLLKIQALWDKMKNFQLFRANLEIMIQINGTPFHYGRLMACWLPNYLNGGFEDFRNSHYNNPYALSGFPHILVTPTSSVVARMQIPCTIPNPRMNLAHLINIEPVKSNVQRRLNNFGVLAIVVLNPLRAPPPVAPVSVTVFARFRKLQLDAQTVYQASYSLPDLAFTSYTDLPTIKYINRGLGFSSPETMDHKPKGKNLEGEYNPLEPICRDAQSGIESINSDSKNVYEETVEKKANGEQRQKSEKNATSDSYIRAQRTVGIAKQVTSIGLTLAKIVGTALSFALQKPNSSAQKTEVVMSTPVFSHSRGLESARTLGISADNQVGSLYRLMGDTPMAMDLHAMMSRSQLWLQGELTDQMAPGTRIFCLPVSPVCIPTIDLPLISPTSIGVMHNALSYVTSACDYFRGSIIYEFQFVASSFHSMRLRIGWNPVYPTDSGFDVNQNETNITSHIIDIKTDSTIAIEVPFCNSLAFLENTPASIEGVDLETTLNGYLTLTAFNQLTHSSTPITPVQFNVWIRAGSFTQLGKPNGILMSTLLPQRVAIFREAQAGNESIKSKVVQIHKNTQYKLENYCFGEELVNVKDFICRPTAQWTLTTSPSLITFMNVIHQINVNPYAPPIEYFGRLFQFCRGSFVFKVPRTTNTTVEFTAMIQKGSIAPPAIANPGAAALQGYQFNIPQNYCFAECVLPYYSNLLFLPAHATTSAVTGLQYSYPVLRIDYEVGTKSSVFVSAGDDFELAFQVGAPTVVWDSTKNPYTR